MTPSEHPGVVYLVGAGPGDPRLITHKGLELLRGCDAVVHDTLVSHALLDEAPPHADRHPVGKRLHGRRVPQEEVNQLLIDLARQGKRVVRLKGGDPFVFGRGGEEAVALADAGISFEVVPGVSSVVAVAAYAGIPLTHRDLTHGFAVVTGHRAPDQPPIPWPELARGVPTLVLVMTVENLPEIVEQLVRHGRPSSTPVAVIESGTTARQRTTVGTLADIAQRAREVGVASPAVAIVGQVVRLRERIAWYERLPLFGWTIVVTRARAQAADFEAQLRALGADVLPCPTVRVVPAKHTDLIHDTLARLDRYDWLVFSSVNGVRYFIERLRECGCDSRALAGTRIVAVGSATAAALETHGIVADVVPNVFRQEGILEAMQDQALAGKRVLFPGAAQARDRLARGLREQGAEVDTLALYDTLSDADDEDRRQVEHAVTQGSVIVTFASSSAVRNFVALMGEAWADAQRDRLVTACIGPLTATTAQQAGFVAAIQPEQSTIPALIEAVTNYIVDQRQPSL